MSEQISWLLKVAVKPGRLDEARTVVAEMVESTQREPGALIYEWSVSDDGSVMEAYERYADSEALVSHVAAFGENFAERLLAAVDVTGFVVYGTPTEHAKEALSGFSPVYMEPVGGFARL